MNPQDVGSKTREETGPVRRPLSAHVTPTNQKCRLETEDLLPETGNLCLEIEYMKLGNEDRSRKISKKFVSKLQEYSCGLILSEI